MGCSARLNFYQKMRKILMVLSLLASLCCKAQMSPSQQQAYNFGRSMALIETGKSQLLSHDYDGAWESFREALFDLGNEEAAAYLGVMVELEMGLEKDLSLVDELYETAANGKNGFGRTAGRAAQQRIKRDGYWAATDENRTAFLQNLAISMQANGMNYGVGMGSMGSNSGSSTSSGSSCSGCGGTGRCTTCSGQGYYWHETGYYTGSSRKEKTTCPVCSGSGRCGVCYGKGRL